MLLLPVKKIGTFVRYQPGPRPGVVGQVYFTNLRDVPGDPRISGLGTNTNNNYADTYKFTEYYPDANLTPSHVTNFDIANADADTRLGGKRKKRSRKSRKSRQGRRTRRSRRSRKYKK